MTNHQTETKGWTSASSAQADLLCTVRHQMQKGIPDTRSADASFGNRVHEGLAKGDPAGLTAAEADIFESCEEITARKLAEFFGAEQVKDVMLWKEKRFWIKFSSALMPGKLLEHSGQADRVYRLGTRLFIPDYKTLPGDQPESPVNLQLRDLAVLAAHELIADEVAVLVIQPLVTHSPEITLYQKGHLALAKQQMYERIDKSNYPGTDVPSPGDVQCKFCRAKQKCVPYQRWSAGMVLAVQEVLGTPVQQWTEEQCSFFCDRFSVAQRWLNDTWDAVEARKQLNPAFMPDWVIQPGKARRPITDPQTVFERFVQLAPDDMNITQRFLKAVDVVKGRLSEEIADLTGTKGVKLRKVMETLLEGCTTEKDTKPVMVRKTFPDAIADGDAP